MFVCLWTYNVHFPFEAPEDLVAGYRGREGPGLKNPVYGAQVEATDRAVGRVLEAIEALGIAGNTVVIFTSDNGGWEGATDNRPLRSGKGDLYEGGLRVPLLVRWPGTVQEPGSLCETPVITMDLTATVLDAAGLGDGLAEPLDGISLRPLLEGTEFDRGPLFFHYPHYAWHRSNRPGGAIRSGSWKCIRRYDDQSLELFDLSPGSGRREQPGGTGIATGSRAQQRLARWLRESGAQMPAAIQ